MIHNCMIVNSVKSNIGSPIGRLAGKREQNIAFQVLMYAIERQTTHKKS